SLSYGDASDSFCLAARCHAANVHFSSTAMIHHASPVPSQCPSCVGTGRVYGQYAYLSSSPAEFFDRLVDESAFARPCRTSYADCEGFYCKWIQLVNEWATID